MDIGVIAEESFDIDVLYELTNKLINTNRFSFKKFAAHGCGKLRRKCRAWAENLLMRGCAHLVVLHDLDDRSEEELRAELRGSVTDVGFTGYIILIPIHEIEAWLLTDADALRKVFNMTKTPKVPNNPETIINPKQKLRDTVRKYAKKDYINSIHNQKIARCLAISKLNKKCRSFQTYPRFIKDSFRNVN